MSRDTISDHLYGHDRLYASWNGWRWAAHFLRRGRFLAAVRQMWLAYVHGYNGETCEDCGRAYIHWYASDDLYGNVTDRWPTLWRDGSGRSEAAVGLFCPNCFDKRARNRGIRLQWVPERFESGESS